MQAVWPDWVIFDSSWWQMLLEQQTKYLISFGGATLKNIIF